MTEKENLLYKEVSRLEAENELLRKRMETLDSMYREQYARSERLSRYCNDLEWLREYEAGRMAQ